MKRITPILIAIWLITNNLLAQDPQFSQFYSNPALMNPAFTGTVGNRFAANYRMQWVGIPKAYTTFAATFDMPVNFGGTHHGVGLSTMVDRAGEGSLQNIRINALYSFDLQISESSSILLGLTGGITQSSLALHKLRFPNQFTDISGFDPNALSGESGGQSRINEYVGTGLMFFNKYIYAGGSVDNLTEPTQKFLTGGSAVNAKLPMKMTFNAGASIPLDNEKENGKSIAPAAMYRMQGPFSQLDLGMYVGIPPVSIGFWYRGIFAQDKTDAIIAMIGFRFDKFRFGYSYDYTISTLTNSSSAGSHEISVVVEFDKERHKKQKQLPCPKF